jgi:tripartite-type tricarboxylate transporter receptor subunit TctC
LVYFYLRRLVMDRRLFAQASIGAALTAAFNPSALAQAKVENLRIIVGFPPGGTTDAFARRVGEKLRGVYATNVMIDNKPGAGGQLGVITLKSAAGDGAHILYTPASMLTIYPHSYSKLQYAQSDVVPLTVGHASDHAFAVGPAVPESVKDIKGFIVWAKANPDKVTIGNPGAGSMPHLLAARLAALAGFQITNVPVLAQVFHRFWVVKSLECHPHWVTGFSMLKPAKYVCCPHLVQHARHS